MAELCLATLWVTRKKLMAAKHVLFTLGSWSGMGGEGRGNARGSGAHARAGVLRGGGWLMGAVGETKDGADSSPPCDSCVRSRAETTCKPARDRPEIREFSSWSPTESCFAWGPVTRSVVTRSVPPIACPWSRASPPLCPRASSSLWSLCMRFVATAPPRWSFRC